MLRKHFWAVFIIYIVINEVHKFCNPVTGPKYCLNTVLNIGNIDLKSNIKHII